MKQLLEAISKKEKRRDRQHGKEESNSTIDERLDRNCRNADTRTPFHRSSYAWHLFASALATITARCHIERHVMENKELEALEIAKTLCELTPTKEEKDKRFNCKTN